MGEGEEGEEGGEERAKVSKRSVQLGSNLTRPDSRALSRAF